MASNNPALNLTNAQNHPPNLIWAHNQPLNLKNGWHRSHTNQPAPSTLAGTQQQTQLA